MAFTKPQKQWLGEAERVAQICALDLGAIGAIASNERIANRTNRCKLNRRSDQLVDGNSREEHGSFSQLRLSRPS
jgi:hypothetical protein